MLPTSQHQALTPGPSPFREREGRARTALTILAFITLWSTLILAALAYEAKLYFDRLPPLDMTAANQRSPIVVDRRGQLLRPFTTAQGIWRLPVRAAEVDQRYLSMLFAYEDKRFREHHGVDPYAMLRAVGQLVLHQRVVSGGSTLTMQVARLIEPREQRTLEAKLRQAARAIDLERRYSKDELLDLYLALTPMAAILKACAPLRSLISARSRSGFPWPKPPCWSPCRNRPAPAGQTVSPNARASLVTACLTARWRPGLSRQRKPKTPSARPCPTAASTSRRSPPMRRRQPTRPIPASR